MQGPGGCHIGLRAWAHPLTAPPTQTRFLSRAPRDRTSMDIPGMSVGVCPGEARNSLPWGPESRGPGCHGPAAPGASSDRGRP